MSSKWKRKRNKKQSGSESTIGNGGEQNAPNPPIRTEKKAETRTEKKKAESKKKSHKMDSKKQLKHHKMDRKKQSQNKTHHKHKKPDVEFENVVENMQFNNKTETQKYREEISNYIENTTSNGLKAAKAKGSGSGTYTVHRTPCTLYAVYLLFVPFIRPLFHRLLRVTNDPLHQSPPPQ